jgi:hypothetical protein
LGKNFLKWFFWQLNRDAAPGVDQVDFYEYRENPDENIANLVKRLKQKSFRAKLVRRQYIPKINGELRPLGIPELDALCVTEVSIAGKGPITESPSPASSVAKSCERPMSNCPPSCQAKASK